MDRLPTLVSWARLALLLVPLFGLASAIQLGCDLKGANDVGALAPTSSDDGRASASKDPGGDGYGDYGYGDYGDDGYGYGYDDGYGDP